ncbi:hypothetical protein L1987_02529 [Smallanthus sonchifolius]|uniref:Uncharacterized protein n=1 Tax=Smallanthus sonchifolius TaxID=185202 RepID=A0ACB9K890_9ASTR|nr:hypothetical protein L1987_02529 [Smallanthus sonchifolius]
MFHPLVFNHYGVLVDKNNLIVENNLKNGFDWIEIIIGWFSVGFTIFGCFLLLVLLRANFMLCSVQLVILFSPETEGSYLVELMLEPLLETAILELDGVL